MLNETKQKEKRRRKKKKKRTSENLARKSREGKEKWQGLNYAWYKFHEGKFADRTLTTENEKEFDVYWNLNGR